jgi:putative endonuclease
MYYIYILQSEINKNKIYVGFTNNLKRRFFEHNIGKNYSTKKDKPYRIVYYEAFLSKQDALDREHKLKHHGSVIGHLKKRIQKSLTS